LVVQGLARGIVLRPTQYLPYSRGDVQILPDSEALLAGARASARYLRETHGETQGETPGAEERHMRGVRQRMVAAAAAAETEAWFDYEAVKLSVDPANNLAPLNQFNETAASTAVGSVHGAVVRALAETPMPPAASDSKEAETVDGSAVQEQGAGGGSAASGDGDGLYAGSQALRWIENAIDTEQLETDRDVEAETEVLASLEIQVWLEFDEMLRLLRQAAAAANQPPPGVPSQILGLLPSAPSEGWPDSFALTSVAAKLREQYDKTRPMEIGMTMGGRPSATGEVRPNGFVPADPRYPSRKRAERLSWVLWAMIGDQKVGVNSFGGSPYQALLEADVTTDRLRMVRLKLREIKQRLQV
jgi:hypothetical protein